MDTKNDAHGTNLPTVEVIIQFNKIGYRPNANTDRATSRSWAVRIEYTRAMKEFRLSRVRNASMASFVSCRSCCLISSVTSVTCTAL